MQTLIEMLSRILNRVSNQSGTTDYYELYLQEKERADELEEYKAGIQLDIQRAEELSNKVIEELNKWTG